MQLYLQHFNVSSAQVALHCVYVTFVGTAMRSSKIRTMKDLIYMYVHIILYIYSYIYFCTFEMQNKAPYNIFYIFIYAVRETTESQYLSLSLSLALSNFCVTSFCIVSFLLIVIVSFWASLLSLHAVSWMCFSFFHCHNIYFCSYVLAEGHISILSSQRKSS